MSCFRSVFIKVLYKKVPMMLHILPAYLQWSPPTYTERVGYESVHFGSDQKTKCTNDAIFKKKTTASARQTP